MSVSAVQSVSHGASNPTIAAGAGAGTAPTVSMDSGSTDVAGIINCTTGTAPAAGVLVTVTFASAFRTAPKVVLLTNAARPSAATPLVLNSENITTTAFDVATLSTPTASKAYKFAYVVIPEDGA